MIHGLLNLVMMKSGALQSRDYVLKECEDPMFFPKRGAEIILKGKKIGQIGVLHPKVLKSFDLIYPVCAFEINMETLFKFFKGEEL